MNVILGTAQLTRNYGVTNPRAGAADPSRFLRFAWDLGVRAVDTSPIYGSAESTIGLSGLPFEVHTKLNPALNPYRSLQHSFEKLNRETIEVLYFHRDLSKHSLSRSNLVTLVESAGNRVKSWGASLYEPTEMEVLVALPEIKTIQVPFNVFDRRFDADLLTPFVNRGGKVVVRSVFLQGVLLAESGNLPNRLSNLEPFLLNFDRLCKVWGVRRIDAAIGFVTSRLPFAQLAVGVSDEKDLESILVAASRKISPDFFVAMDSLKRPKFKMVDPRRW